ncbi:MAG TPA: HEAT repeat domain-containing protein [Bryobacteraceae bacterium]|nr:HEAT repeat domain-containing protein [Bryobacteraceae bacterium]
MRLLGIGDCDPSPAKACLKQRDLRQTAIPHLILALSDTSMAADAAELLGYHVVTEAVRSLVSALKSADQRTRLQAARALMVISSTEKITYEEVQPLIDAALGSEHEIRRYAVQSIARFPDIRTLEALCANVKDPIVGEYAVVGLGNLRDPRAIGALAKVLTPNSSITSKAVCALREIGGDSALETLLHHAKSAETVSRELCDCIATFVKEPATEFLIQHGAWRCLWPAHKLLVLSSRHRCQRLAEFVLTSISRGERYSMLLGAQILTAILREQGGALEDHLIRNILMLEEPAPGWADPGYEEEQWRADAENRAAYYDLIKAANAETDRRGP